MFVTNTRLTTIDFPFPKPSLDLDVEVGDVFWEAAGNRYPLRISPQWHPLENDQFANWKISEDVNHQMGVSWNEGTQEWMVFNGRFGGTPMLGNLQISMGPFSFILNYPVVNGGRDPERTWGIHIPYIFLLKWEAKELRIEFPKDLIASHCEFCIFEAVWCSITHLNNPCLPWHILGWISQSLGISKQYFVWILLKENMVSC